MSSRPVIAEINVSALRNNYLLLKRAAGARTFAVIKANAYGHGTSVVTSALNGIVDGYATVDFDSARDIRESGFAGPILMLNGMFEVEDGRLAVEHGLWLVIHQQWQFDWIMGSGCRARPRMFLKVNTGMNRLGFTVERAMALLRILRSDGGCGDTVLMTHFAETESKGGVATQLAHMKPLMDEFGLPLSLSNSAGVLFQDVSCKQLWVRCGIALYGASPSPTFKSAAELGLQPAMTLKAKLIDVHRLGKGERIGYDGTFTADREMMIGHVACGYGDGYPRCAGEAEAPVMVNGTRSRMVGRVSMDLSAIDLTGIAVGIGDDVELFGRMVPVDEIAVKCGTIGYEIFTNISASVFRRTV